MRNYPSYRTHKVKLLMYNAKNLNKSAILIFFQALLNLSENWSLVTCITNLGRIPEKLFKLMLTPTPPNFNSNSPPFLIKRRAKNCFEY